MSAWIDARHACRRLIATPTVTLIAVVSLALGIGGNSAIFSVLDALILRDLPVNQPERLVVLGLGDDSGPPNVFTNPVWEKLRGRQREIFAGAFAWARARFTMTHAGESDVIDALYASGDIFAVLGTPAFIGRPFSEADDQRGGGRSGPVVVVSYGFWQRRLGGDVRAIGSSIDLGGSVPFTIIGVMPKGFFGPEVGRTFDVIVPLGTEPIIDGRNSMLDEYLGRWLTIMARLGPGETAEAAEAALRGVQPQIRMETLPPNASADDLSSYLREPLSVRPGARGDSSTLRQRYSRPLLAIFLLANVVLLIACANIAALLLAQAIARSRDVAIRVALGAPRWRIARERFLESALLSVAGAALGLAAASWWSRLLVRAISTQLNTIWLDVGLNARMVLFSTALAIGTTFVFGVAPALLASRVSSLDLINERSMASRPRRSGLILNAGIVCQVSLCFVLVLAASLFVRTYVALIARPPGLDPANVLVVTVIAPPDRFAGQDTLKLSERLRASVAAVPGVTAVAVSLIAPLSGVSSQVAIEVPGLRLSKDQREVYANAISPGWFTTYGTPLVAGRDFSERDRKDTTPVAIVNRTFVETFMPGVDPLTQTVGFPSGPNQRLLRMHIVGVASDAVYRSLRDPMPPTVYLALAQRQRASSLAIFSMAVKTNHAVSSLSRPIGAAITATNGNFQYRFRALADQLRALTAQERLVATLAGFFGVLALVLALAGIYGVTAYTVARHRRDIGIRMALGASGPRLVRSVVIQFGAHVVLGVVAGMMVSAWAVQFVKSLLFGVRPQDSVHLMATAVVLSGIGALAAWIPVRAAAHVSPTVALRTE
jgi:predicted permease